MNPENFTSFKLYKKYWNLNTYSKHSFLLQVKLGSKLSYNQINYVLID